MPTVHLRIKVHNIESKEYELEIVGNGKTYCQTVCPGNMEVEFTMPLEQANELIIKDCSGLIFDELSFDDVDISDSAYNYVNDKICCINFHSPIYDWIIANVTTPKLYNVGTSKRTDYRLDPPELTELEELLENHAHILNKSP